ncbi:hypothetical protein IT398_02905 [Candidatus Nomurabacteria bacterium]|nr:hypothetical protein [Candidatus Nomurabacteria bacterium]
MSEKEFVEAAQRAGLTRQGEAIMRKLYGLPFNPRDIPSDEVRAQEIFESAWAEFQKGRRGQC